MTIEDRRDAMIESIIQGAMEDFDMRYTDEELESMLETEHLYFDKFYSEPLEVTGYEKVTLKEMLNLPYKDILTIYNRIHGYQES